VFLHASAKPADNLPAYDATWNYADTAGLLGEYEVLYDDGFMEAIPVRYGVNVLEAGWGTSHAARNLAYEADLVDCGKPGGERVTFFAYEWLNPRFGTPVKEVRLRGTEGFRNARGRLAANNSILLAGLSVVKRRIPPEPKPTPARRFR
jgi:hypothetical protein